MNGYRIVPGVFARTLDTLAPRRAELVDALADMGTGLVIDSTGVVVAFHESQLRFVEAGVGDYRVSPHPSPATTYEGLTDEEWHDMPMSGMDH